MGKRQWLEIDMQPSVEIALEALYSADIVRSIVDKALPVDCTWTYDDIDHYWSTGCKRAFHFEDGTPKDNGIRFCSHCGGKLIEAASKPEVVDK